MKEVPKQEFYAAIASLDVTLRADSQYDFCEYVMRYSGNIIGRVCDSISIDDTTENYYVSTYYLNK